MYASDATQGPVGTRRERQKAETRAVILDSARYLFEEKGFKQTTIRTVAAHAGVGLGTIFNHFPDKESLLIATLIDDLHKVDQLAWKTMPVGVSVMERMLHLAREGFRSWLQQPALSSVLIREMCFTAGPARDQLRALDRQAMQRVAGLLEEARQQGEIRSETDPELAARTVFSFYLTTVLFWLDEANTRGATNDGESGRDPLVSRLEQMVEDSRRFLEQLFNGIGVVDTVAKKKSTRVVWRRSKKSKTE